MLAMIHDRDTVLWYCWDKAVTVLLDDWMKVVLCELRLNLELPVG